MGKLNTAMRTFLCDRERFADLFNGVFFQGKPVIRADRLLETSETYSDITENPLDRTRDLKMVTGDGETLRILALENQANIDYTLPYRCMQDLSPRTFLPGLGRGNPEDSVHHSECTKVVE